MGALCMIVRVLVNKNELVLYGSATTCLTLLSITFVEGFVDEEDN